jgi:isopentenyl phosphate kinase
MLILKLGGAAITDKMRPNTADYAAIREIAGLLAAHPQPMVLVHGAGSFGHILAQEYHLHLGYQKPEQRDALVQLQIQLHELNRILVEALIEVGLPAMTLHPASMSIMHEGRIAEFFLEPVRYTLKLGLIPVLYGDCVWDSAQTFGIISGDQLVVYLANVLNAERVAFGTNVDGVMDVHGNVISHLEDITSFAEQRGNAAPTDVTGGMLGKLREIAELDHAPAWIFNLQNRDQLARVLSGEGAGTHIKMQQTP